MAEAKDDRSTPRVRKLMSADDVLDWIAFRRWGQRWGQPLRPLVEVHDPEIEAWRRTFWRGWADEDQLMPALQAGKLELLYRPANDRFAEPKTMDPSALQGLRRLDDVLRVGGDHWRITRDRPVGFLFDEAQVHALWPEQAATDAPSDKTTSSLSEAEPTPIEIQDGAHPSLSPEDAALPMPATAPDAQSLQKSRRKVLINYTEEDNNIARKSLAERGWDKDPAKHKDKFWQLAKDEAPRLPGFGKGPVKIDRLRRAIARVTGIPTRGGKTWIT